MTEERLYQILLAGWTALALLAFAALFFVPAPYGRHRRGGWGPEVPDRLGWVLMELPAVLTIAACWLAGEAAAVPEAAP